MLDPGFTLSKPQAHHQAADTVVTLPEAADSRPETSGWGQFIGPEV